jgi:hypothetical protein
VEKYSALLEVPGEEQLPVDVNHRDMCKFASRDDETYQKLWKRMRRIIQASEDGQRSAIRDGKSVSICKERIYRIRLY